MSKNAGENLKELMKIMEENPGLPVLPMVDAEIICDDTYGRWTGSFGSCHVEKVISGHDVKGIAVEEERLYFYSDREEITDILYEDGYMENVCDEMCDALPWQEVIIVNIDLPN